jgi:hypothetical protein
MSAAFTSDAFAMSLIVTVLKSRRENRSRAARINRSAEYSDPFLGRRPAARFFGLLLGMTCMHRPDADVQNFGNADHRVTARKQTVNPRLRQLTKIRQGMPAILESARTGRHSNRRTESLRFRTAVQDDA